MFVKKILVMKQMAENSLNFGNKACGICRLEKEDDLLTLYLSVIGFPTLTAGEYRLYMVGDNKKLIKRQLGNSPASCTQVINSDLDVSKGVSAGIWTVKDDLPLLFVYKKSEDAALSVKDYGSLVVNDIIAERKLREREKDFSSETVLKSEETTVYNDDDKINDEENDLALPPPITADIYNDEAVATENYYDVEDEIQQKLSSIKDMSDEYVRVKECGGDSFCPQKEKESEKDLNFNQNETTDFGSESATYYDTVKTELDGIFDKYPEETDIEKIIDGSRFAKVYYAENKYYVVGLVKENDKAKYICYGVPSPYSPTPPKELAGYCSFIPLSIFNLKGDGYFMMFQDAISGKCVLKK